jgi:hypothetical protein
VWAVKLESPCTLLKIFYVILKITSDLQLLNFTQHVNDWNRETLFILIPAKTEDC